MMARAAAAIALACLPAGLPAQTALTPPGPARAADRGPGRMSDYNRQNYGGFVTYVHNDVFDHRNDPAFKRKPLDVLAGEFRDFLKAMPADAVAAIRPRVRVWVEWDRVEPENSDAVAVFRGGTGDAMRAHGVLSEKANGVEIISLRKIAMTKQPGVSNPVCVLLHEMAHAYHHQVIGPDNPAVKSAFRAAMDRRLYRNVQDIVGKRGPAYATTNEYEYFAEVSESYLLANDYFPFDRQQLRDYDVVGYRLCEDAWASVKSARELGRNGPTLVRADGERGRGPASRAPRRPASDAEVSAAQRLDLAKQYLAANDAEHARGLLAKVIAETPNTVAAREAEVLLEAMPARKKK